MKMSGNSGRFRVHRRIVALRAVPWVDEGMKQCGTCLLDLLEVLQSAVQRRGLKIRPLVCAEVLRNSLRIEEAWRRLESS